MQCPRCSAPLVEIDRSGITIDRCDGCRGIWLDRGELEKLLALRDDRQDDDDDGPGRGPGRGRDRDDDDDDSDDGDRRGRRGGERRRWWEIFD